MTRARWIRNIVWAAGIFLLVSLAVPWVTVTFWRQGIAAALSQGLGRPVRIGAVHVRLLDGPGFEIEDVVVEEDPRFGFEPFARMESLRARVALGSLWERRFRFSTLVLVRPSLNVVRAAGGQWNLGALWSASASSASFASSASSPSSASLPAIRVESARINFKSQGQKQVYVIDDLDLDLTPPSTPQQPWALRFEGTPSRTDSLVRPVSRIEGRVELASFSTGIQEETGIPVRLDLSAQGAHLAEFLRISLGSDYGIHGLLNFQLHLAGTTSLLRVSGKASLAELHRWDLLSPPGAPTLTGEITGFLDPVADSLELTSLSLPLPQGSVILQGRIAQLFHRPRPDLRAQIEGVSVATLVEIAKSFTNRLETRFLGQGTLTGELQMGGSLSTLRGNLRVTDGVLEEQGTRSALRFSDFPVAVDGETGSLGPVRVNLGKGSNLGIALQWDRARRAAKVHVEGVAVPVNTLLEWAQKLGGRSIHVGVEQGNMALRADISLAAGKPPQIRGTAELSEAVINSAAVHAPIRIASARLSFQRDQVLVKSFAAALGEIQLRGSLRAWPFPRVMPGVAAERRPRIEFDWHVSEVDLEELDRLFRARDRLASFLRFWNREEAQASFLGMRLDTLAARGSLQSDAVVYRGVAIKNFRASVEVQDRVLEIREFTGEVAGGAQSGKATIQWGSGRPRFRVETRVANLDLNQLALEGGFGNNLFSGKLSGTVRLAASGRDRNEILETLGGAGSVTGHNLTLFKLDGLANAGQELNSIRRMASLSAAFQIARNEALLTDLRVIPQAAASEEETPDEAHAWRVTGTVGFNGRLNVRVKEPVGAEYHWTGTLAEPRAREIRPEQEPPLSAAAPRK